jgi:hypothetical protein
MRGGKEHVEIIGKEAKGKETTRKTTTYLDR